MVYSLEVKPNNGRKPGKFIRNFRPFPFPPFWLLGSKQDHIIEDASSPLTQRISFIHSILLLLSHFRLISFSTPDKTPVHTCGNPHKTGETKTSHQPLEEIV